MIPFRVFDYERRTPEGYTWAGYLWCIRCEDWIPWGAAVGAPGSAHDPHATEHVEAWELMRAVERKSLVAFKGQ